LGLVRKGKAGMGGRLSGAGRSKARSGLERQAKAGKYIKNHELIKRRVKWLQERDRQQYRHKHRRW
jgi:hypothetical protein